MLGWVSCIFLLLVCKCSPKALGISNVPGFRAHLHDKEDLQLKRTFHLAKRKDSLVLWRSYTDVAVELISLPQSTGHLVNEVSIAPSADDRGPFLDPHEMVKATQVSAAAIGLCTPPHHTTDLESVDKEPVSSTEYRRQGERYRKGNKDKDRDKDRDRDRDRDKKTEEEEEKEKEEEK